MIKIFKSIAPRIKNKFKTDLYWWDPLDGSINTGDFLSKVIVDKILESRLLKLDGRKTRRNRIFAVGSILHYAKDGDCVWGSGCNGNIGINHYIFNNLDIRAVRGPLTRDFLMRRDIDCPDLFGDPAILMPMLYSKSLFNKSSKKLEYLVVPHFSADLDKFSKYKENICETNAHPLIFIEKIINSKFVISSSLHGLILADAYGIPAVYLNAGHTENRFKYDDYYFGTNRFTYQVANSVENALLIGPTASVDLEDQAEKLLTAFPFDLWAQ